MYTVYIQYTYTRNHMLVSFIGLIEKLEVIPWRTKS